MDWLIEDNDLLEKYNTNWDKISADIQKIDSKPIYCKECIKTRIRSHGDGVTDFYHERIPKVYPNHSCLAVISFDSALQKVESYYPQVLKVFKYIEKKSQ